MSKGWMLEHNLFTLGHANFRKSFSIGILLGHCLVHHKGDETS